MASINFLLVVAAVVFLPTGTAFAQQRAVNLDHYCSSLDPIRASHSHCYRLLTDVYEGLLRIGPDGEPQPGVAERWEWDEDDKAVTFFLRTNRRWSDGNPVVANDFAVSWQRILRDDSTTNPLRRFLVKIEGASACTPDSAIDCASGIEVVDDLTLRIQFDSLDQLFPLRTINGALMPIPSHFYKQHGEKWAYHVDRPFNGPYKLAAPMMVTADALATSNLELVPNNEHPDVTGDFIQNIVYRYKRILGSNASVREIIYQADVSDIVFEVADISADAKKFILANGWVSSSQNNVAVLAMLLNLNTVDSNLIEAIKLILHPVEISSRIPVELGNPAIRLFNHRSAMAPFNKKHYTLKRQKRHELVRSMLKKLDISRNNRRKISAVTFESVDAKQLSLIVDLLAMEGIDLNIESWSHGYVDRKLASQDKLDAVFVFWFVSVPDPSGFLLIPDWSPIPILSKEQSLTYDQIRGAGDAIMPKRKRLMQLHRAEEFLVNNGAIVPLWVPNQSIMHKNQLCGIVGSQSLTSPSMWIRWCD